MLSSEAFTVTNLPTAWAFVELIRRVVGIRPASVRGIVVRMNVVPIVTVFGLGEGTA